MDMIFRNIVLSCLFSVLPLSGTTAQCETPEEVTPPPIFFNVVKKDISYPLNTEFHVSIQWDSLEIGLVAERDPPPFLSATSYLSNSKNNDNKRPIIFFFNGGPGASSSPLHFSMGPFTRNKTDQTKPAFPLNPDSLIDTADLVFIDPIDTGFSRSNSDEAADKYLDINNDAEAVALFIRTWIKEYKREDAPIFITGQSYGGFRLGKLLPYLEEVTPAGLIMVSPMLDGSLSNYDQAFISTLPTMTATAWRYGKSALDLPLERDVFDRAQEFAETEYLLALQKGDKLPQDEAEHIAQTLSKLTGLDKAAILSQNLRIDTQYFLENLLAEDNKLISRLNTAKAVVKKPPQREDRPDAANDPSLALGRSNVIAAPDIADYLKEKTGIEFEDDYRSLNLDANFGWNWSSGRAYSPTLSAIKPLRDYLTKHNKTQLLVFTGMRDLAVPAGTVEYILDHSGLPANQVDFQILEGGHSPYEETTQFPIFTNLIRELVRETTSDKTSQEKDG